MNEKTNSRSKWLTKWPWRILAMVTFVFPEVQAQVLDVGTDLTLPPGVHTYESIIVHNGATLKLQSDPLAGAGVTLETATLIIEAGASVSAAGTGFTPGEGPGGSTSDRVGAAHGGRGGGTTSTTIVYGSAIRPLTLGSGGSGGTGAGGGAVHLVIAGLLQLDGTLTASATGRSHAGGSILIEAERVQGAGHIQANGSPGECPSCTATFPGGGGGRIAVYYHTRDFTGAVQAFGGSDSKGGRSTSMSGEDGTVGWFDVSDPARVRLTAGHSWRFQSSDALDGEIVYQSIDLVGTTAAMEAGVTEVRAVEDFRLRRLAETNATRLGLYSATGVVTLAAANLTVEMDCAVDAAGKGFAPGEGPGGSTSDQVGAAHGGRGGGTVSTKVVYGSATWPLTLGSGGGGGSGGAGGGAIRLTIDGVLHIDGTLTADASGRSHAGGSILIEAERVQGAGHIQANGSPGECPSCTATFPGGGGGRIAIYYHTRDFTGAVQAFGGSDSKGGRSTSMSGQDGTVGWFDVSDPARVRLTAGHSWRFQSSDALDGEIVYQSIDLVGTTAAMEAGVTEVRAVEDFRLRRLAETNATRLGLYSATGVVTLAAANLTVEVDCAVDAAGKGFSPGEGPGGSTSDQVGAAHGGRGGGTVSTKVVYGSATWPLTLGSGGGGGTGAGGGAIRLTIDGVLHIDGTLTADASGRSHAGGSILIEAERVQGAGSIQANGSPGECPSCTATFPGGGGGRIAVYYHTRDFTGAVQAFGGSDSKGGRSTSMSGEDGTVGWFDVSDPARVRLTAGHSWRFQSSDAVGGEIVFEDVTLHDTIASVEEGVSRIRAARDFTLSRTAETNSCILELYGPTGTLTFAGQRIGIGAGCVVSVSGKGFGPDEGPGASASVTGAGHGGRGGGSFGPGGPTYGSDRYPVAWGSSSEDPSGRGGGALHVVATELLHLDGLFEADAIRGDGGGSSGGSIWVETGRIQGTGTLQANGARGGCTSCTEARGGGGGGRIAIHFAQRAFAGAAHAAGGLDNHNVPSGQNGTVLWVREVPIQIGATVRVAHEPLVHYTFRLDWPDLADNVVLVRLTPREAVGDWTLAGEFGQTTAGQTAPWRGVTVGAPPQTGFEMLVPLGAPGRYYFDVVNTVWNLDEPAGAFDLEVVDVDRYVVPSSLGSGGNAGTTTLTLVGTGFEPGMRVRLRDASSQTLREFAAGDFDSIGLAVTADLTGLAPGVVDVVVVWPDAAQIVLPQAFSITGGAPGRLALSAEFPGSVRSLRVYTMWVDCANTGATDLPVPLLRISSLDNRTMRLSPADPFVHGPLWALPIREGAPYEVLPPGGRIRFPVEVIPEGGQHTLNKFLIEAVGAVDEPVRWDDLKLGARPEGVSPDAWDIIWSNFTPEMGNTWAEFIQKLRKDAVYLARLGNPTRDVRRLLELEFAAASSSTGMDRPFLRQTDASSTAADAPPLAFVRYHNNLIFGRSEESPLGLGWTHCYDFRLTRPEPDIVQIQLPSRFVRRFYRSPRGEWQPGRYDHGRLSETAGGFSLEDGQRTLRFDADGRLESIARTDGRAITLSYAQGQLSEARHSNGERLQLAYAGERLSTLTDHAGRQTLYTYTGNRLTSVAHPDGRMSHYDYHTTDAARNALLSVRLAGGPEREFDYDVAGRLAAQSDADGAHRLEYRYPDLGTIEVLNALAETARLDFDGDKLPLRLTAPLGQQLQFVYREAERSQRLRFPDGSQLEMTYDASGNPVELVDPLGQRLRMEFTPALRQLRWLEDGLGLRTFFAYAAQGSLTNILYADGSQERFTADDAGQTTQIVNRRGQTIDLVRNPRGRIIEKRVEV